MTADVQPSLFDLGEPDLSVTSSTSSDPSLDFDQIPLTASAPIPVGTYQTLDQISAHCEACQRCTLSQGRTHAVVFRGNPQAHILIIGEAPGENEDIQGKPFVGKSGQLLDKILESVGLDSAQDTYICNTIKCRPPGNRVPTPDEMDACRPYLLEQIRIVDPKIVLLTGATSVRSILSDKRGITKIRGEWLEWQGRWAMPIFHPAYLLRNASRNPGSPKWLMWQDIQKIKEKYLELGLSRSSG